MYSSPTSEARVCVRGQGAHAPRSSAVFVTVSRVRAVKEHNKNTSTQERRSDTISVQERCCLVTVLSLVARSSLVVPSPILFGRAVTR